jgi:hypothetical protein
MQQFAHRYCAADEKALNRQINDGEGYVAE